MNEVYLRGKLVSVYESVTPASQHKHLTYQLRVAHRTAQQQVKFENYTINAWRNLAVWASANLQVGMDVFVRGHLSQRQTSMGAVTEVTALTITPVAGRSLMQKPVSKMGNRAEEQDAEHFASDPDTNDQANSEL